MVNRGKLIVGDSRSMAELKDESVSLVVTSPPYWHIKDYGIDDQIGYGQTLHGYLKDLRQVWGECHRVLEKGRRLCINIGDQFTRAKTYGRYKVIPIHSEFISQCEGIGFDYMGSVIWQKKTTINSSGGAAIMGSYPYPPNGVVEIDYEYILLFKKRGKSRIDREMKERSGMTKEEWKEYFSGHWKFKGERQVEHVAMFPEELPRRLIKMFSLVGEIVLDPFLGSGTTIKVARELDRRGVGFEVNADYLDLIRRKVGEIEVIKGEGGPPGDCDYTPSIRDHHHLGVERAEPELNKVVGVEGPDSLRLDDGSIVNLLGIGIVDEDRAMEYLREMVVGKRVMVKEDSMNDSGAYVYLKNRIFVNQYMIESGMAEARNDIFYDKLDRFNSRSR